MRLKTILKSIFIVLCFSFLFISCGEKKEAEEAINNKIILIDVIDPDNRGDIY